MNLKEQNTRKNIAILGSTGSIGTQALEVIDSQPDSFRVELLTANTNAELLLEQSLKYKPDTVVIADDSKYKWLSEKLSSTEIKVFGGQESLEQVVQMENIDLVLTALVGFSGLKPTLKAIESGKPVAIANKETLVVAGDLVTKTAMENGVNLFPVDSEHSAIFQCLMGEWNNPIEKIVLTASGGPFRGKKIHELEEVSLQQALNHPNWTMGNKITIDSATMMNKGLEMIEARWLFDLSPDQIEVIVHPQSIIHSIVQFRDGSMKAQMGLPDMKLPIQFAMNYPDRLNSDFPRFSFHEYPQLTFEQPDFETFSCLELATTAMNKGGNAPCILNGANEIAVQAFLEEKIGFLQIPQIIEETMGSVNFRSETDLDIYLESDRLARETASRLAGLKLV